jgi:ribosomal protein L11 methyltransferase
MPWVCVNFEVEAAWADAVGDALLEAGAVSVEITDAEAGTLREAPLFREPGGEENGLWSRNRLSVLFEAGAEHARALAYASATLGIPVPDPIDIEVVSDQDWVRATQQQFGPIEISRRLWIVPSWCEPPVAGAIVLNLDPGLAFGTGSHPTTWQCLRWLDQHLRPGESVLDYGCGSGILAIAARKLGAGPVTGTDIDPNALQASRYNATENGAAVEFVSPDALSDKRFDVVVANILANPLKVLAPLLAAHARAEGRLVLAGILDAQADAVCEAYLQWFVVTDSHQREGWTCLAATRRL